MIKLKMSKTEWLSIGKQAGWFSKEAKNSERVKGIWQQYKQLVTNGTNTPADDKHFLLEMKGELSVGDPTFDPQFAMNIEKHLTNWSRGTLSTQDAARVINKLIGFGEFGTAEPVPGLDALRKQRVEGLPNYDTAIAVASTAVAGSKSSKAG